MPALADEVAAKLEEARRQASDGEVLELPTMAERPVLSGLLATDLSAREIGRRS